MELRRVSTCGRRRSAMAARRVRLASPRIERHLAGVRIDFDDRVRPARDALSFLARLLGALFGNLAHRFARLILVRVDGPGFTSLTSFGFLLEAVVAGFGPLF